jgi:hypothetical protein
VRIEVARGAEVILADRAFLNTGVQVICHSAIEIGPHCRIGPDCVLCDTNHHPVHEGDAVRVAPIRLGATWLGREVIVLPGVTIGDHAVVAAGSVVAQTFPRGSVARQPGLLCQGRALLTRFRQALTKPGLVFFPAAADCADLVEPTMLLTFIGAIQVLFGLGLFLAGSIEAMFAFLLVSALFGGSAAIVLPALGGSSIPPVQFALVFMALRLLVPGAGHGAAVGQAARANIWLATFILYGAALAFIGPRCLPGRST